MSKIQERKFKEIQDSSYALTYHDTRDSFICNECGKDKEGLHMVHSIFFAHYTDEAPICLECVQNHINTYGSDENLA